MTTGPVCLPTNTSLLKISTYWNTDSILLKLANPHHTDGRARTTRALVAFQRYYQVKALAEDPEYDCSNQLIIDQTFEAPTAKAV